MCSSRREPTFSWPFPHQFSATVKAIPSACSPSDAAKIPRRSAPSSLRLANDTIPRRFFA